MGILFGPVMTQLGASAMNARKLAERGWETHESVSFNGGPKTVIAKATSAPTSTISQE
jgi:hypothetical protein